MSDHLDIQSLALVHSTADKPLPIGDALKIDTSFARAGGLAQQSDNIKGRQTLHFCLQSAVTDHAYGKFEGRKWVVVAPLEEALVENGRPESLLASDVAFFPRGGSMTLPKAQLIEFTDALPPTEFIRSTQEGFQVSRVLNTSNLPQAQVWFDELATQGVDVSAIQKQLKSPSQQWTNAQITEFAVSSALARLGKPSLHHLKGLEPGTPMSFDGWANPTELDSLKHHIESSYTSDGAGSVFVGRHDGMAGDRLLSAVARLNYDEILEIQNNPATPPRIKDAAQEWSQSNLIARHRASVISHDLREGPELIANDIGQERPGIVGAFFGFQSNLAFKHPQLGQVTLDEVNNVVKGLSVSERNQMEARWDERFQEGGNMASSFQHAKSWLTSFNHQPPTPPLPLQVTLPTIDEWRSHRATALPKPLPPQGLKL